MMEVEPLVEGRSRFYTDTDIDTASLSSSGYYNNRLSRSNSLTSHDDSLSSISSDKEICDDVTLLQACVFIEDALKYRSIHHKIDEKTLKLYRIYYSKPIQWLLYVTIFTIHVLAFFEHPSSVTTSWSSDLRKPGDRREAPCGLMESIELICLLIFLCDIVTKSYLIGLKRMSKSKWVIAYIIIMSLSLIDWFITVGSGCHETVRFRRILRPFFLLQNSTLMKKTVNCLRRTLPEVASVLLMLALHLYFFTLLGMLVFKPLTAKAKPISHANRTNESIYSTDTMRKPSKTLEGSKFFPTLGDAFMSLLVLLTTANNPDVTIPSYSENRFAALFFIVFLVIGLYCLMNMLTAIIYNQFKGIFTNSMQSSLFRKRVGIRAAFEVLRKRQILFRHKSAINTFSQGVPVSILKQVVSNCKLEQQQRKVISRGLDSRMGSMLSAAQFQDVFSILDREYTDIQKPDIVWAQNRYLQKFQFIVSHRGFQYFGNLIALANVICITVELGMDYDNITTMKNNKLNAANMAFITYYFFEQGSKLWSLGWRLYVWDRGNVFDGILTILLVLSEALYIVVFGFPFTSNKNDYSTVISLWDAVRVINILIMVRLMRVITQIKTMSLVVITLLDLVRNLRAFAGILVVIFYSFAILGIELFQGKIKYPANYTLGNCSDGSCCGTYEQLDYWANNFDDFAAALVVLWDVMVVNNWMVFLQAYSRHTGTKWSQLYFIIWWLLSVLISLHVFTALIIENFTMRWDRHQETRDRIDDNSLSMNPLTVHDMFRDSLQEPAENEILLELRNHAHLQLDTG